MLSFKSGKVTGNYVQYSLSERNKFGLGGGMFLGVSSFAIRSVAFTNNSAYFGGALYTSANFSGGGPLLEDLNFGTNYGLMGMCQFSLISIALSSLKFNSAAMVFEAHTL